MSASLPNSTHEPDRLVPHDWRQLVPEFVNSLRFGIVQIVVHEGRVTQIEKTERVRLDKARETAKH